MSGLPGYDAWKLASPPEYDVPDTCPACGEQFEGTTQCASCGWGEPEDELDDHDHACDSARDDEMADAATSRDTAGIARGR